MPSELNPQPVILQSPEQLLRLHGLAEAAEDALRLLAEGLGVPRGAEGAAAAASQLTAASHARAAAFETAAAAFGGAAAAQRAAADPAAALLETAASDDEPHGGSGGGGRLGDGDDDGRSEAGGEPTAEIVFRPVFVQTPSAAGASREPPHNAIQFHVAVLLKVSARVCRQRSKLPHVVCWFRGLIVQSRFCHGWLAPSGCCMISPPGFWVMCRVLPLTGRPCNPRWRHTLPLMCPFSIIFITYVLVPACVQEPGRRAGPPPPEVDAVLQRPAVRSLMEPLEALIEAASECGALWGCWASGLLGRLAVFRMVLISGMVRIGCEEPLAGSLTSI